jgi:hypothetical protein
MLIAKVGRLVLGIFGPGQPPFLVFAVVAEPGGFGPNCGFGPVNSEWQPCGLRFHWSWGLTRNVPRDKLLLDGTMF